MIKLIKNKEYEKMFPRLSFDQYMALRNDIKEKGLINPIIYNKKNEILDGYNRYEICKELKIEPKVEQKIFDTQEEELAFIISVNYQRRHLSTMQKVEIMMPLYDKYKAKAQEMRKKDRTTKKLNSSKGQRLDRILYKLIAKEIDSDDALVQKAVRIFRSDRKGIIQEVKDGLITLHEGYTRVLHSEMVEKQEQVSEEPVYDYKEESIKDKEKTGPKPKVGYTPLSQIQCTVCDGYGSLHLKDFLENVKFQPNWYLANTEYHFFIGDTRTLCHILKPRFASHTGKKILEEKPDKKFCCKDCLRILTAATIKVIPEVC